MSEAQEYSTNQVQESVKLANQNVPVTAVNQGVPATTTQYVSNAATSSYVVQP